MTGEIKAGTKVYLITHAYYHVVGEIAELLGPQRGRVINQRLIIRSGYSWGEFFARGFGPAGTTVYHKLPPGELSWFNAWEWEHEIP